MYNEFGISSIGQHNKREAHHFKHPQVLVGVAKDVLIQSLSVFGGNM